MGIMLLFFVTTPLLAQPCDCITTGNCPVPIEDNGTFFGTLDVTVDGPNDLGACPLTQVCFSITHTWVGDLSVALTSPSGVNYLVMADLDNNFGGCGTDADNLDVCIDVGVGNPLTNNTEYDCATSGPCFSGTCCMTGSFTVPCGGVSDPVSGAAEAPTCNLNDFNIPGNPANGTWTLTVNDICAADIGTLNNFSLDFSCGVQICTVCNAEGGSLDADDVSSCFGDPSLNLDLEPNYNGSNEEPPAGEYSYAYVLSQNGVIVQVNPTADMSFQPPGVYDVCGLSYLTIAIGEIQTLVGMDLQATQTLLAGTTAPFCADISDDCITVTIGEVIPPTVLETFVCLGECIMLGSVEVCQSGEVVFESVLGCDSIINVVMIPIFIPPTTTDTTLCPGECMELNGIIYCPPGPHSITFESYQGCDSVVTYLMFEEITEAFIFPNPPPALSCTNTSFFLNGASSIPVGVNYMWTGPNNLMSTDPAILVSAPGVYSLTIENNALNPACFATTEVTVTGSVEDPDLQVNGTPPSICVGDTFDLASLNIVDLNNTGATLTFHNATPATPANELPSTIVSPADSTTYYILGTVGSCSDETSVILSVNALPIADFEVDSPVCQTDTTLITYLGAVDTSGTFNWNFSGGTAIPGTGPGPHQVTWATSGSKIITLVVTDNGCTSTSVSHTVQIDPPLPEPVVNCSPSVDIILFTWNAVPGANGYNVNVAIGPFGTMTSDTSYLVSGLSAGEQVSIFVEAISGNACGNTTTQITCTAQDCPQITITVQPVPDICLDGTQSTITLIATQTGGDDSGVYTFTGPGVNPISGTFNPDNANVGPNNILVTYEEGTCLYNSSMVINVFPQPTADFTVTDPICLDASSTINYIGNASSNADFTWDFNGGTAVPGTGPGPHTVTWADGGSYPILLRVEENGCISDTASQLVNVETPLPLPQITCDGNTSTVEFFWDPVPGAIDYTVNVLLGMGGTPTSDTSILFSGLDPGDVISIEVIANGSGPCGSSSEQANCIANDCDDNLTIEIEPINDICLDTTVTSFNLVPTITGGMGGGTLSWMGDGIIDTLAGTFDPQAGVLGENVVTAIYKEENCIYTEDFSIYVYGLPIASFTTNSPICEDDELTLSFDGPVVPGLTFNWDFGTGTAMPGTGQGPHDIIWAGNGTHTISLVVENANGCVSDIFESEIQIDAPLIAPLISCNSTTSTLEFTWPTIAGATDYQVEVLSGQIGTFTPPDTYFFDGLQPNEEVTIALTISGDGACPPITIEETCEAIDCPTIDIELMPDSTSVCISTGTLIDFEAIVIGGNGTGVESWTGDGIIDQDLGIFDPTVAGIGLHTVTFSYKEGNCSYLSSTTVEVFAEPTADFTATPTICETGSAALVYTGNAALDADFTWDLDGGILDVAQQTISWDMPGTYSLSLTVEQDGCVSQQFTQDVQVTPQLADPVIDCDVTVNTVTFNWTDVPGATDYEITVLSGPSGTYTPPGSYFVGNLMPGDEVSIQVIANGNTVCITPVVLANCTAADCPDVTIDLTPVDPLCFNAIANPLPLEAIVTGGSGTGTGTWSGPGVTNGFLNPASAGVGTHTLTYTYEENTNCIFTENMVVEIIAPPVADAGAGGTLTCLDGETDIQLGGTGNPSGSNITYLWEANFGAFPGDPTIVNPIVSLPGTYTLTVTNTDLNCSSSDIVVIEASQETPVPVISLVPISCFGQNDGAIVVNSVTGGEPPYLYAMNGAPFGQSGAFTQLVPGIYELTILDANGCQNMLTFDIQQPQELNVELVVSIEGDDNIITFGESVNMTGVVTVPGDSLDLVQWEPANLVDCDTCLDVVSTPLFQTTFSITVEDNGCSDSDAVTIFVSKERAVFVPNAFSPNGDNINDRFMIFANEDHVVQINSFLIFNRWGETVHQVLDFPPNDPSYGWNGIHRGETLNPAVFTWFIEVEFIDGSTELYEGGVNLLR